MNLEKEDNCKMLKDEIIKALKRVTHKEEINLEFPENEEFGDYSSNIAMAMFSSSKLKVKSVKFKNPRELAEEIVEKLQKDKELVKFVEKIEVAGAGFINFWLSEKALLEELDWAQKEGYGSSDSLKNKKIMIEFTDPNPFKEFHIGHMYSNSVGESLSRLLEALGANVKRANYQGDIGLHVAKSIWALLRQGYGGQGMKKLEEMSLEDRIKVMGQAYIQGATAYEEDEEAKKEIIALNEKIFANDVEVYSLYQKGRSWSLEYFEKIYKRLGTKFDYYYFESEVGKIGKDLVNENLKKKIFVKSKGAIIFPGSKYKLHDRVFINSLGLPTYEAKELGLAPTKFKDFAYDQSVIITGNEINEYFKVLIKALSFINLQLAQKTKHIGHGMIRIPQGKMSSRTGKVITAEGLLDEVKSKALKLVSKDFPENEKEEIAEKVSVAAVKYSMLKVGIGKDITFDFEKSLSLEGDSGPYLQYTIARTNSVLAKKSLQGATLQGEYSNLDLNDEELKVLRSLSRLPEIIATSAKSYSPNVLCNYLFDLAQKYNNFYNTHRILDPEVKGKGQEVKDFRIMLTRGTGQVLKSGLSLLGIETPERM